MTLKLGAWWWWWSWYWHGVCLSQSGPLHLRTIDWVVYKQEKFIFCGSGFWKSGIRVPAQLGSGQDCLVCGCLVASFHGREGEMALPLYMDINPNMEVPPSRPSHLPKAPHPHTITLGVRVSAYGFGGDMLRGRHKLFSTVWGQTTSTLIKGSDSVPSVSWQDISSLLMYLEYIQPFRLSFCVPGALNNTVRQRQRLIQIQKGGISQDIWGHLFHVS